MRFTVNFACLMAGMAISGCAARSQDFAPTTSPIKVDFAHDMDGRTPRGFTTALTGGGGPVSWKIRDLPAAPNGGKVLVQESTDDTSYRFPICVYDDFVARDVAAEVKFKAIAGTVDQAGGLVLRYSNENYYIARANALEDNVSLFKTISGKRLKIAEVDVRVTPNEWHALGFEARGDHLTVTFDGKTVIESTDMTFTAVGKVGLWTKADSVTAFTDLKMRSLP